MSLSLNEALQREARLPTVTTYSPSRQWQHEGEVAWHGCNPCSSMTKACNPSARICCPRVTLHAILYAVL